MNGIYLVMGFGCLAFARNSFALLILMRKNDDVRAETKLYRNKHRMM